MQIFKKICKNDLILNFDIDTINYKVFLNFDVVKKVNNINIDILD